MNALKITGIIILVGITALVSLYCFIRYRANNIADTRDLKERIDKRVEKELNDQKRKGIIVGVVKNGTVFIKGYGTVKEGLQEKPDSMTLFELASIGKLFTTSALQIGISRREFGLNDPIATYLPPEIALPNTFRATLLNLATHTAGLPSLPKNMIEKMKDEKNPYKDISMNDLYDYLKRCDENTPVGQYEYSNFGMGLLGHILELKYGQTYEHIIQKEIGATIGMDNTVITRSEEQEKKLAQGYDETGQPNPVWQDTVLAGAGSFLSNAADMTKFIKANLDVRYCAISPQLIACHEPQLSGETGLGWHLATGFFDDLLGIKGIIWHNGGAGGYSSYIALDKQSKSGIIIMSNSATDITDFGMKLMLLVKNISLH